SRFYEPPPPPFQQIRFDIVVEFGAFRSRANDAHITGEDRPELWYLVQMGFSENSPDACHARVDTTDILFTQFRAGFRLGVWNHTPKLEYRKGVAEFGGPFLTV